MTERLRSLDDIKKAAEVVDSELFAVSLNTPHNAEQAHALGNINIGAVDSFGEMRHLEGMLDALKFILGEDSPKIGELDAKYNPSTVERSRQEETRRPDPLGR